MAWQNYEGQHPANRLDLAFGAETDRQPPRCNNFWFDCLSFKNIAFALH
jgi:hypothetical protein